LSNLHHKSKYAALILVMVSFFLVGCSLQESQKTAITTLKMGVLPDEKKDVLLDRYEPLREHLSDSLGIPVELIIPDDYAALVQAFGNGLIDLAYFGGFTFVQAYQQFGAVPLVLRDIDTRFTSYFVTRKDHPAKELAQFKGAAFAFGSELSTSGHLMPRHFLNIQDIDAENFFQDVRYSGAHDKTVEWVRDNEVEIGAVNAQVFRSMLADRRLKPDELRVVYETPPYTDYVWAVQSRVDEKTFLKLRDAFLFLSPDDELHLEILNKMNSGGFLPANAGSFADLMSTADALGLIE
jgi:phosphonate transport system substrate-binding protein